MNRPLLLAFLFVTFFVGLSSQVHADSAVGFGCTYSGGGTVQNLVCQNKTIATFTMKALGKVIPDDLTETHIAFNRKTNLSDVNSSIFKGFKVNHTIFLNSTFITKLQISNIAQVANLTWEVNSSYNLQQVGTGIYLIPVDSYRKNEAGQTVHYFDYYTVGYSDAIVSCTDYNLTCASFLNYSNASNQTIGYIKATGFSAQTALLLKSGNRAIFDPTIDYFSANAFSNGMFNETYLNDSQSVFQLYYANNNSFAISGQYFSQLFVINRTNSTSYLLQGLNWTWYEAMGFGQNDSAILSFHMENDTKDSSRFNFSAFNSSNGGLKLNQSGKLGLAYSFNGVDGRGFPNTGMINGSVTSPANWFADNATVAAWILTKDTTNTMGVFSKFTSGGDYNGLILVVGHSAPTLGKVCLWVGLLATDWFCSSASVNNGAWHHVIATVNGTTERIYIDGALDAAQTAPSGTHLASNQNYQIGSRYDSEYSFNGTIDELHVFNRSLSSSEVSQLYNWENGGGTGNNGYIHNFTNVTMAVRNKNYTFDDTNLTFWVDLGDMNDNETNLNTTTDIISANKGQYFGKTWINTTNAVIGNSVEFNAANQGEIKFTDNANTTVNSNNFTICAWFNPNAAGSLKEGLLGTLGGNNGFQGYLLAYNSNAGATRLYVETYDGTNNPNGFSNNTGVILSFGTWNLGCVVRNKAKGVYEFFLNGTTAGTVSDTVTGSITNSQVPQIGVGQPSTTGGGTFFDGKIDDVKLWQRVLSGAEIKNLYNSGNPSGTNGKETNFSSWKGEFNGGNATPNIYGNIVQYRATFNSTGGTNFSAFLSNVTLTYNIPQASGGGGPVFVPPVCSINIPIDQNNQSSTTLIVNYSGNSSVNNFGNATLLTNFSGSWANNVTNGSAILNGSYSNNLTAFGIKDGRYIYGIYIADANGTNTCGNQTITIDATPPLPVIQVTPTNFSNSSSAFQWINFTVQDALSGTRNGTLIIQDAASGKIQNVTDNNTMINGSTISIGLTLGEGRYNASETVRDWAGNTANSTIAFNFTIDRTAPTITRTSPIAFLNISTRTVTFSYTCSDSLTGCANTTLYVWLNGSIVNSTFNGTGVNGSVITNTLFLSKDGVYNFTVGGFDFAGNSVNQSFENFTVDTVTPITTLTTPTLFYNQSTGLVHFTFTPFGGSSGIANTTLFVFNVSNGGTIANLSNNLTVTNNSQITVDLNIPTDARFNWTVQAISYAGLMANTSRGNFTLDSQVPNYLVVTSPINNSYNNNVGWVNSSFYCGDALSGCVNTTVWAININGTYSAQSWTNFTGNASVVFNNFSGLGNGTWYLTYQACDADLCTNFTKLTRFDMNNTSPLAFIAPVVTLVFPPDTQNVSTQNINFQAFANSTDNSFGNLTLYGTWSGSWATNVTNGSAVINGSAGVNFLNVTGIPEGTWVWNVRACDKNGCTFANSNRTITVDKTNPNYFVIVSPLNNSYVNASWMNVSFILGDGLSLIRNSTFWVTNLSNGFYFGSVDNTTVNNGTMVTFNFSGLDNSSKNITVQTCDWTGNCLNITRAWFVNINITQVAQPSDTQPPQWTNNRTNNTIAGLTTLFQVNWTDNIQLNNYTFEFDNGNGTLQNLSINISMLGLANVSNATFALNSTPNSTIRWRFYAWDNSSNMNATNLFTFVTTETQAPQFTNNQSNETRAGFLTNLALNWTDNFQLNNFTFEIDNGNGTLINQTVQNFIGTANQSNWTFYLNATVFTIVRWRVYAWDYFGNMNASLLYVINTTDGTPPQWFSPSNNQTTAGTLVQFSVFWTDNTRLDAWIFSFDNGTGTFVNDTPIYHAASTASNWTNVTKFVNQTTGSLIRWIVYANDSVNLWNNTGIQSFTTSAPIKPPSGDIFNICPTGQYRPGKAGQLLFQAKNSSGNLLDGLTCQISIYDKNNTLVTNNGPMTGLGGGTYNATINMTLVGHYTATMNCSGTALPDTKQFDVINSCVPISLSMNTGGEQMGLEFNLVGFLAVLTIVIILASWYIKNYILLIIGGIFGMVTGALFILGDPALSLANTVADNTTLILDAQGQVAGAATTFTKTPVTGIYAWALGIMFLLLGIGMTLLAISFLYLSRNGAQTPPDQME